MYLQVEGDRVHDFCSRTCARSAGVLQDARPAWQDEGIPEAVECVFTAMVSCSEKCTNALAIFVSRMQRQSDMVSDFFSSHKGEEVSSTELVGLLQKLLLGMREFPTFLSEFDAECLIQLRGLAARWNILFRHVCKNDNMAYFPGFDPKTCPACQREFAAQRSMEQHLHAKHDDAHLLHKSLLRVLGSLGCQSPSLAEDSISDPVGAAGAGAGEKSDKTPEKRGQRLLSVLRRLDGIVREGDRTEDE